MAKKPRQWKAWAVVDSDTGELETEVTVTITQRGRGECAVTTTTVTATGGEGMTSTAILGVFESALRGAGYHCPNESLNIEDDRV